MRDTRPHAVRRPLNCPSRARRRGSTGPRLSSRPSPVSPACRRLLEQVVSCGGLLPGAGLPEEQTVTWFQFHSYLQRQGVSDLEKHFAQLTKEGRGWEGGRLKATPRTKESPSVEPSVLALWKPGSLNHCVFPLRLSFQDPRWN